MKEPGSIYKPKRVPEKYDEEEYEQYLNEKNELVPKTIVRYETKDYEEKDDGKKVEIKRDKIGVQVIKNLLRNSQTPEIEPMELESTGSKVFGTLFDKIKFLRVRIDEMEEALMLREEMNSRFNKEIDIDIHDLESFLEKLSIKEDVREFKLNISLLRMEKRKENNLFWRDMTLLKQQLRELKEEYETESNISQLFSGMKGLR